MLVLSRKRNQCLFIDDNVVVRVLSIHGSRVRLGIEADTGIPVHRRAAHGTKKVAGQWKRNPARRSTRVNTD